MSTTIDQKVVQMKFDNKDFEQNISTSMSTVQKFNNSLNFDGALKGIDEFSKSASRFSLGNIGEAAEGVSVKFDALQVAAVTALTKITSAAIDAGAKLVKAFAIEPITQGLNEYNLKMDSVQTIMAGTGENLDTVMDKLNELNKYADQTIYSFSDMTSNIGKFTNAGVSLNDAVDAIQGVANVAAVSGANAQNASHAMYNFAQALSAGYVKLIDWKSIEIANMATVEFKTELLEAAAAAGTVEKTADGMYRVLTENGKGSTMDGLIDATHNFNDSLNFQWMTTEVLVDALSHYSTDIRKISEDERLAYEEKLRLNGYTDEQIKKIEELGQKAFDSAQDVKTFKQLMDTLQEAAGSGWAETWEIVFGDFNEAKKLWTEFSYVFGDMISVISDARNELLGGGLTSGWKLFLGDNRRDADIYEAKLKEVARANGVAIDDMISDFGSFEATLKNGWLNSKILEDFFLPGGKAIEEFSEAELEAIGYTQEEADAVKALGRSFIDSKKSVDEWTMILGRQSGRENVIEAFWNAWNNGLTVLSAVRDAFAAVIPPITSESIYQLTVLLIEFTERFKLSEEAVTGLKNILTLVLSPLKILFELIGNGLHLFGQLAGFAFDLADGFLASFASAESLQKILKDIFGEDRYTRAATAQDKIAHNLADAFASIKDRLAALKEQFKGSEKIQEALKSIHDILAPIGEWILDRIVEGLEAIAEIDFVKLIDKAENGLAALGLRFEDIESFVVNALTAIRDFFTQINGAQNLEAFLSSIKALKDAVFSGPSGTFNLDAALNALWTSIEKALPILTVVRDELLNFVKQITPAKVLVFAFRLAIVDMFMSISKAFGGISGVFESVTGLFDTLQKRFRVDPVLRIATAIGILAASLTVLSLVDPAGLRQATWSLGIMAGVLTIMVGVVAAIEKFVINSEADALRFQQLSKGFLALSASLLAMAGALWVVSQVDVSHIAGQLIAFTVVLGELIGAVFILNRIGPNLERTSLFFISFTGSILLLTLSLKTISSIKLNEVKDGLSALTMMIGLMTALALASKATGLGSASGITALAIGVIAMVGAFKMLQNVDVKDLFKTIPQLLILTTMMIPLGIALRLAGEHTAKAGIGIALISAAVVILSEAVKRLGELDLATLIKGTIVVGALMIFVNEFTLLGKEMVGNLARAGVGILLMSASVVILSFAIKKIGELDLASVIKGTIAVSAIIYLFSLVVQAGRKFTASAGAIAAMAVAVGILSAAIIVMSLIPFEEAMSAALSLSITLLSFAGAIRLLGEINFKQAALSTTFMVVVVTGLIVAFKQMQELDGMNTLELAGALSATALALAGVIKVLSTIPAASGLKSFIPGIAAMGILLAGLIGIVVGIGAIAEHTELISNGVVALKMFETLWAVLGGALLLTAALGAVGKFVSGPELLHGIAGFASVIFVVSLITVILGGLVNDPFIADLIDKGAKVFTNLGEVIGLFFGNVVGGFIGGIGSSISNQLPNIAQNVADFAEKISGIGAIDEGVTSGLKSLADAVLAFTQAELLDGLSKLIPLLGQKTSFADFGDELIEFAPKLAEFADATAEHDFSSVESAANGAKALADIVDALPARDGLTQKIIGNPGDLKTFGEGLDVLGKAMADFYDGTKDIDTDIIDRSIAIGKSLAELNNTLPPSGGVLQDFLGEKNLNTFSDGIVKFAKAMVDFSDTISGDENGVNLEAISQSAEIGQALADLNNSLPPTGGKLQKWMGEKDLETFATNLPVFAHGLLNFNGVLKMAGPDGFSQALMESAVNTGKMLAELNKVIPTTGGFMGLLFGDSSLGTFGNNIGAFGNGLKTYFDDIVNIDTVKFESSLDLAKTLVDISKSIDDYGGLEKLFQMTNVDTFSKALGNFGGGLATFYDKVSGIAWSDVDTATVSIARLVNLVKGMGDINEERAKSFNTSLYYLSIAGITGFLNAFTEKEQEFKTAGESVINVIRDGILLKFPDLNSSGVNAVTQFFSGFDQQKNSLARNKGAELIQIVISGVSSQNAQLSAAGVTTIVSFVSGMSSQQQSIGVQSAAIVKSAVTAIQNGLDISSGRSRVFEVVGIQIVAGLVYGMTKYESAASITSASKKLIDNAEKAMKKAAEIHSPSRRSAREVGKPLGQGVGVGFIDSIKSVKDNVVDGISSLIAGAKEKAGGGIETIKENTTGTLGKLVDEAKEKAGGLTEMVPTGFESLLPDTMEESVTSMIDTLMDGTSDLPTTFEDIGGNAIVNLGDGMLDKLGIAQSNVAVVTTNIADTMRTGLSDIDNIDVQPSITPVYDLDEMATPDLDAVGAWNWSADNANLNAISSWSTQDAERIDDIIAKLQTLTDNMHRDLELLQDNQISLMMYLGEHIPELESMGVYLNGDAVVGELAPSINTMLGAMMARERRQ